MLTVPALKVSAEGFGSEGGLDGQVLTLHLTGNADMAALSGFEQLVVAAHDEARRFNVREVVVNVHRLDFMNSSCFKCLITWINRVQAVDTAARYQLHFITRSDVYWQRRSFESLKYYAKDVVVIVAS
jgi:hypothetical protein